MSILRPTLDSKLAYSVVDQLSPGTFLWNAPSSVPYAGSSGARDGPVGVGIGDGRGAARVYLTASFGLRAPSRAENTLRAPPRVATRRVMRPVRMLRARSLAVL